MHAAYREVGTYRAAAVNHDPKRQHLSEKKMVENGST
jgi:hypothetical protein